MPHCPLIRPFDPLDIHIGQHNEDAAYIQEILYYLDSRFRAVLIHRSTGEFNDTVRRFIFAGISLELQLQEFALAHAAVAGILMKPVDIPILTRLLAIHLIPHRHSFDNVTLSRELRLQLDASLDLDDPAAVVNSYFSPWWITETPDYDEYGCIDNTTILQALAHHVGERRRSSRKPIDHNEPVPTGAGLMNDIRNHTDGYRTIFQSRIHLTARRAAGFFMLGEAAHSKADDLATPEFDPQSNIDPQLLRLSAAEAVLTQIHSLPTKRNLGVGLSRVEAMQVFSPPEGTRSQCRTRFLPAGTDILVRTPPESRMEPHSDDTFSIIDEGQHAPSLLDTGDIPVHFHDTPLRNIHGFGPPLRTLGLATDPDYAYSVPDKQPRMPDLHPHVKEWLRSPHRNTVAGAHAGVKQAHVDLPESPVRNIARQPPDTMEINSDEGFQDNLLSRFVFGGSEDLQSDATGVFAPSDMTSSMKAIHPSNQEVNRPDDNRHVHFSDDNIYFPLAQTTLSPAEHSGSVPVPSDDTDITSGRFLFHDTSMCREGAKSSTITDVPHAGRSGTPSPANIPHNTMITPLDISGHQLSLGPYPPGLYVGPCDVDSPPDTEERFSFGDSDNEFASGGNDYSDDGPGGPEDGIEEDAPHASHIEDRFCFSRSDNEDSGSEDDYSEEESGEAEDDIDEGGADSSPDETTEENRPRGSFTASSFAHIPDDEFA